MEERMKSLNQHNLIIDRVDQGIFEINRDEEVFDWEMQYHAGRRSRAC